MTINDAFTALLTDLRDGGLEHPLGEYFTLATIWPDLARVAGEPVAAEVDRLVGGPPPPRLLRSMPKPAYPCAGCGSPIADDGGVCDGCAGFEDASHSCESCGAPADHDPALGVALCQPCIAGGREYARRVWGLLA